MIHLRLPLLLLLILPFASQAFAADPEAVAMLWKRMDAALTAAEKVPETERRPRALALMEEGSAVDEKLDNLLLSIALRPQSSGAHHLLHFSMTTIRNSVPMPITFDDAASFLEQLYRQRAAGSGPDAIQWKAGLSDVLLHVGRFDEARLNQRAVVAGTDEPFKRVFLAVAEVAAGNRDAWKELVANCPKPPQTWLDDLGPGADPRRYCDEVAAGIARRAMQVLRDKTPPALAELAAGRGSGLIDDWRSRMHGLREAVAAGAAGTGERLLEIVRDRESSPEMIDDATYLLALHSVNERDHKATVGWSGCWLRRRAIPIAALPADGWQRFSSMPLPERAPPLPGDRGRDCFHYTTVNDDAPLAIYTPCVLVTLFDRAQSAARAKQWEVVRETVENFLAIGLATDPRYVAQELTSAASAYFKEGGPDAAKLVRYVSELPHPGTFLGGVLQKATAAHPEKVTEPWKAPTAAPPSLLAADCPR